MSSGRTLPGRALACVIGDMDLIRPLGLAGIPCAAVARPGSPVTYSKFVRETVAWVDPWREPGKLVERLMKFSARQTEKPILFYEGDWDLLLVSRFRESLASAFRFVVADSQLVENLVDKARFVQLARKLELPVPPAQHLSFTNGARPQDLQLRFPVVVKPLTRQRETWRPIAVEGTAQEPKAVRVRDIHEMRDLWPLLARSELDVLVQELIPGPESRIESWHAYVDETGEVVGSFTGRKIRTLPAAYGYSSALEITSSAEVASLGADLMKRLGLTGVVKIDFKRDERGRLYLLEVNPRFNLWHHPGAVAGINLPALVYSDLTGITRPSVTEAKVGVQWCRYRRDVRAARAARIPFLRWLVWSLSCEAKSPSPFDDPMPIIRGVVWSSIRGNR